MTVEAHGQLAGGSSTRHQSPTRLPDHFRNDLITRSSALTRLGEELSTIRPASTGSSVARDCRLIRCLSIPASALCLIYRNLLAQTNFK